MTNLLCDKFKVCSLHVRLDKNDASSRQASTLIALLQKCNEHMQYNKEMRGRVRSWGWPWSNSHFVLECNAYFLERLRCVSARPALSLFSEVIIAVAPLSSRWFPSKLIFSSNGAYGRDLDSAEKKSSVRIGLMLSTHRGGLQRPCSPSTQFCTTALPFANFDPIKKCL